jgi:hypothetical protein
MILPGIQGRNIFTPENLNNKSKFRLVNQNYIHIKIQVIILNFRVCKRQLATP